MKRKNRTLFGRCMLLLPLFIPFNAGAQNENVSTWGFANNIGWKGIEVHYVAAIGSDAFFNSAADLANYTLPDQQAALNQHMPYINNFRLAEGFLYAETRSLNVHGIFLPFRKSKFNFIRRIEWQTGFEYHLKSPRENYELDGNEWAVQLYNRNLFYSNKLIAEFKIAKSIKLYFGPQFKFTLVPLERLELALWENKGQPGLFDKYLGVEQLNSTRFAVGYGYNAGMKINLSCRFNFHFEYQYYSLYRFMQLGDLSMGYHGFSMGIRYKFIKPDPEDEEKEYSPFW